MSLYKKIKSAYQKEGWGGIKRRIEMRLNDTRRKGLKGFIDQIKGGILYIKNGRYSLKYAYDGYFYNENLIDSRPMAEYLAPKIINTLSIKSVIDLGCATGHWINAFTKAGADVVGVEGGEEARPLLLCPPDKVIFADLREPLNINRDFDLVTSIEVAEHIEHKYVNEYVDNMTRFNPKLIMITAAPPGQGGDFHVNEQKKEYWDNIFNNKGYKRVFTVESLISKFIEEAKAEKNPPEIMCNPKIKHEGVYIPFWMPSNLMVFSKNPENFQNLVIN